MVVTDRGIIFNIQHFRSMMARDPHDSLFKGLSFALPLVCQS